MHSYRPHLMLVLIFVFFLGAAQLALTGCVKVGVTRIGERVPPRGETCQLELKYGDMTQVMQFMQKNFYVQVASATIMNAGDDYNPTMLKHLRPEACRAGGEVVFMTSSSSASNGPSGSGTADFVILRPFGAAPARSAGPR